jgi:hypothetical protein
MAQPYVTGACSVWAGIGAGSAPVFVGHAEQGMSIDIRAGWEPVMNDLAGTKVPFDMSYQGEEAILSGTLTRWNEAVVAAMAARWNAQASFLGGPQRGSENTFARGTLMLTEGAAFPIWLNFPLSSIAAFATLPDGYRFAAGFLESPDRLEPGTRPYKIQMIWHCLAVFTPSNGSFLLYDHDMSAVAALPLN